ncbi:MAG: hydrolase [Actinobacteria bacterium]|nr:MAG: hydrolase [Actinomycetota bacterium]
MASTRLVLWDVDGTLVHAGDAAVRAFDVAVERVIGRPAGQHGVRMSGKTDPQIALEILQFARVGAGEAHAHLPLVLEHLENEAAAAVHDLQEHGRVMPGVVELLTQLHIAPDVVSSVLTGNIEPNARLKVAAFGLDRWLDLDVGAYGSDDHDRNQLVPIALAKLASQRGMELRAVDVWIVGDTPRDLECARAGGARCLLVGTGRFPTEELRALGPEAAVDDLRDVDAMYDLLTAG